jgi:hypothetical protein
VLLEYRTAHVALQLADAAKELAQFKVDGIFSSSALSPMMYFQSARLARLATEYRLPATPIFRLLAEAGGGVSYGSSVAVTTERSTALVAKILGHERAACGP